MESLNPPAFYTFLTPDEDGECHGQEVKPCGGGMNGELQGLGAYKASADSSDDSCLIACFETLNQLLNLSGPQYISTELEEGC